MNNYFNLIYLIIIFIFIIIVAFIATPLFLPNPTDLILNTNVIKPKNIKDYLYELYNNGIDSPKNPVLEDIINYKFLNYHKVTSDNVYHYYDNIKSSLNYFNFIYENAPNDVKSSYKTAINTSVCWPPKYNEKFRLLSFPYVSGNIFTGLYQTLAAKSNTATMPCWYISKYDNENYSKSLYNRIFQKTIKSVPIKNLKTPTTIKNYECLLTFFGKVVEYEKPYNELKESSVEFSSIKTGGYILENDYIKLLQDKWDQNPINKKNIDNILSSLENQNYYLEVQHTCFPLPGTDYPYCDDGSWWTYLSTGSGIYWNCKRPIIAKNKLHLLYCCGWTVDNFVDITKDFGGGKNLVEVILKVVYNNEHPNNQKTLTGLGLRTMKGVNGDIVVRKFFVTFIIFLFIIIYLLIQIIKNIYNIFKNFNDKSNIILKSTYIIISLVIIFSLMWYFIFITVNEFFIGLGWMTLDMAYEKTGLSPYKFFEEAIFGTNSNPICNGLNITEWFDEFLYEAVSKKGFLSAIMTQQPNKSGCWMVEMFDVTQYIKTDKSFVPKLGICGKQKLGSGIQYSQNNSDFISKFGIPTILNTVPSKTDCYNTLSHTSSEEEECDELLNNSKIYNCHGCNDSNRSLCISCKGVPISNVCLNNKKIHYGA